MATNKTKPEKASVPAFLEKVPNAARRADAAELNRLMREETGEEPCMWGPSIVGFGTHHYRYESGREGDTPAVGFSPRAAACVLYGLVGAQGSDALLAKLGKCTTGKGCLYIKKLADIDAGVLRQMTRRAFAARQNA